METQAEPQNEVIDLNYDVTEADVARPILQGGTYNFTIQRTYQEQSRKAGIPTLVVVYNLAEVAKDTQGRDVNPGFTVFQRILMKPTGGLTKEMIDQRIKSIHFAAAGEGRVTTGVWIGKTVRCRVSLREAHRDEATGTEYGESNEISRVMPAK
jgi:hypothetical protein